MRVISIINLKGGVGKTFTAANMAYILNGRGYSVLLVDNDKQGNLSKQFGAYEGATEPGTSRLLRGWYKDINDVRRALPAYACMDIITANMQLLQTTHDIARTDDADQVERFKPLLQAYPLEQEKPYDFCIIDNPPDLGLNVLNALVITDDVIVPTKIDKWGLEGLETIIGQVEELKQVNNKISFLGTVVTMYKNNDTNNSGLELLRQEGYKPFDTCIRFSDKAVDSTFFDTPVTAYSPRSGAAQSYKKFVNEYLEKIAYMEYLESPVSKHLEKMEKAYEISKGGIN